MINMKNSAVHGIKCSIDLTLCIYTRLSEMQDMMWGEPAFMTSQLSYVLYSTQPYHASPGVDIKDHSQRS